MKDSEIIREDIITILVLIVTLVFTSCNTSPKSLEGNSLVDRFPLKEAID